MRHDNPLIQPRTVTISRREYEALRAFVQKMWLELDDAADAIGPVPDLVERNLRIWHQEAEGLLR